MEMNLHDMREQPDDQRNIDEEPNARQKFEVVKLTMKNLERIIENNGRAEQEAELSSCSSINGNPKVWLPDGDER